MDKFLKDERPTCKYGAECYQKNPDHKKKFQHPPTKRTDEKHDTQQKAKRFKKDESEAETAPKPKVQEDVASAHNISDSDEESSEPAPAVEPMETEVKKTEDKPKEESVQSESEAEEEDEDELPTSPSDVKTSIKQKFLVEMPKDFYSFWEFCKTASKDKPAEALKDIGLYLAGPYDVLSGKISKSKEKKTLQRFLRHWRYYYDPPEFQTVLVSKDKNLYHIGYFRDDPKEMPCFLASNSAAKDGTITPMGPNIFAAVNAYLEERKKVIDPFAKIKLTKLQKSLQTYAEKEEYKLDTVSSEMKQRTRNRVCKTFHGAGLVVPYNKKSDVGYRPLIENDVKLRKILTTIRSAKSKEETEDAMEALQPIINAANIANDECDFGTSVELGLDLLTFGGKELGKEALILLTTGYSLLNRKEYAEIAKAHLKNRKRGPNVDMFP